MKTIEEKIDELLEKITALCSACPVRHDGIEKRFKELENRWKFAATSIVGLLISIIVFVITASWSDRYERDKLNGQEIRYPNNRNCDTGGNVLRSADRRKAGNEP